MKSGEEIMNNFASKKKLFYAFFVYFGVVNLLYGISILNYASFDSPKGYFDKRYSSIVDAFSENFKKGYEREGANLAVYHNGKLVVNIWQGYSDVDSLRNWTRNTIFPLFSASKAISALCLAILVDRGRLSYEDLVIKYWPEYGENGKENTTIEDVLTHKAGLPYIEGMNIEDVVDHKVLLQKIAKSKPAWTPGTATGYHPVTFGWLIDGIFQGADEKGRDVKTFLHEEIAEKYNLDVSIGLKKKDFHRMARASQPGVFEYIRDIFADLRMISMLAIMYLRHPHSILAQIKMHSSWLPINFDTMSLNDPDVIALNIAAANGVTNAENLAKLFSLAIDGTLLSGDSLKLISKPTLATWHIEKVVLYPFVKGRGFYFEPHPLNKNEYIFGHPGYGCQSIHVDEKNKLVVAYLTNGLKTATGEMCYTYRRIFKAIYRLIGNNSLKQIS